MEGPGRTLPTSQSSLSCSPVFHNKDRKKNSGSSVHVSSIINVQGSDGLHPQERILRNCIHMLSCSPYEVLNIGFGP